MVVLQTVGAVAVGVGGGYVLHRRYSRHASPIQSLIQMLLAATWILAAFATILTGFYGAGALLLALFTYFFLGNAKNVQESDLPSSPSGWRQTASNFDPFGLNNRR